MDDAYFYGAREAPGHYLWTPRGREVDPRAGLVPWSHAELDGRLQPPDPAQPEGVASLHHRGGWTALAFWDRSSDRRLGSCACFAVRGEHVFDEAARLAREAFPWVWSRFRFEVRP